MGESWAVTQSFHQKISSSSSAFYLILLMASFPSWLTKRTKFMRAEFLRLFMHSELKLKLIVYEKSCTFTTTITETSQPNIEEETFSSPSE
jgi:hypothetical protein